MGGRQPSFLPGKCPAVSGLGAASPELPDQRHNGPFELYGDQYIYQDQSAQNERCRSAVSLRTVDKQGGGDEECSRTGYASCASKTSDE